MVSPGLPSTPSSCRVGASSPSPMPPLSPLCKGLQGAGPAQHGAWTSIRFQVAAKTLALIEPRTQPCPSGLAWVRHHHGFRWQCRLSGQSVWSLVAVAFPSRLHLSSPHINTVSGGSPDHNHRHPSDRGRYHRGLRSQFKFLQLTCSQCHGVSRPTSLHRTWLLFLFLCCLSFTYSVFPISPSHFCLLLWGSPPWDLGPCCPPSSDTPMLSLTLPTRLHVLFLLSSSKFSYWKFMGSLPKETMFSSICFCSKKNPI